jgi:oligopeptide/dipeptide ABC transporter ATP-binding protein
MTAPDTATPLLSVQGLTAWVRDVRGVLRPARDLTLEIRAGETVGLVGESGTGKSLAARAMIGLLPADAGIESGTLAWEGTDLARMPARALRRLRGREIALMPQETPDLFDPFATVGTQLARILRRQTGAGRGAARAAALEALQLAGVDDPAARLGARPQLLPTGTRRRVLLAMALICKPRLLIADEPTSGLDKIAEADILALLAECRRDRGIAVLMISRDIAAAARLCDRVLIMYGGRIVESGYMHEVMAAPQHPYTRGLVASIPRGTWHDGMTPPIRGEAADLARLPTGCAFRPRCPEADPACRGLQPLRLVEEARRVACWRATIAAAGKPRP